MYWNRNDKIQRGISALCTKERKYTPIADHTMNSPGPTTNHTSQIPRKHHHLILTLLSSKPLRYIPSILLLPVPFKTQSFPQSPISQTDAKWRSKTHAYAVPFASKKIPKFCGSQRCWSKLEVRNFLVDGWVVVKYILGNCAAFKSYFFVENGFSLNSGVEWVIDSRYAWL